MMGPCSLGLCISSAYILGSSHTSSDGSAMGPMPKLQCVLMCQAHLEGVQHKTCSVLTDL